MYDAIDLLDTLGRRPAGAAAMQEADALLVSALPHDQALALHAGDAVALARALRARTAMFCMIVAPDEREEPADDERPERDEPDPGDRDRDARQG